MAVYSFTTSVRREAGLQEAVNRENARLASLTPPGTALTNDQYLQLRVRDMLDSYIVLVDRVAARAKLTADDITALGIDPNG